MPYDSVIHVALAHFTMFADHCGSSIIPNKPVIDEVTVDVTAGQNKSSEKKIALQYACTPAGPVV